MTNSLDIIIVNWNSGCHLKNCISSISNAKRDGFILRNLIIVDNGSTDESLDSIDRFGEHVRIIRNLENLGFAVACNQGAALAESEYLLFLNPDTILFEDSLTVPMAFMEDVENAKTGICGIQLVDEYGNDCLSFAKFPILSRFVIESVGLDKIHELFKNCKDEIAHMGSDVINVDQVIGAFFIVRKTVFDKLEGFDERFFVYFEEVDFSLRAKQNGWESVCLSGAKCRHAEGGSSSQVKPARLFYSLRSRLLYGFKHFSQSSAFALLGVTLVPEFIGRLFYSVLRRSWGDVKNTLSGYFMLVMALPLILRVAFDMRKKHKLDKK